MAVLCFEEVEGGREKERRGKQPRRERAAELAAGTKVVEFKVAKGPPANQAEYGGRWR